MLLICLQDPRRTTQKIISALAAPCRLPHRKRTNLCTLLSNPVSFVPVSSAPVRTIASETRGLPCIPQQLILPGNTMRSGVNVYSRNLDLQPLSGSPGVPCVCASMSLSGKFRNASSAPLHTIPRMYTNFARCVSTHNVTCAQNSTVKQQSPRNAERKRKKDLACEQLLLKERLTRHTAKLNSRPAVAFSPPTLMDLESLRDRETEAMMNLEELIQRRNAYAQKAYAERKQAVATLSQLQDRYVVLLRQRNMIARAIQRRKKERLKLIKTLRAIPGYSELRMKRYITQKTNRSPAPTLPSPGDVLRTQPGDTTLDDDTTQNAAPSTAQSDQGSCHKSRTDQPPLYTTSRTAATQFEHAALYERLVHTKGTEEQH